MSDQRLERLSALMDGELNDHLAATLLDQTGSDARFRAAWERYHLIGQALRGEAISPAVRPIAESVAQTLRSEPIQIRRRTGHSGPYSRLASFGGAALAAGAAFLAVFAVPNLFQGSDPQPVEPLAQQAANRAPAAGATERRWDLDRPEVASKLDLYLVNHQEAAPATGVKGMLPYATLVGYEVAR